MAKTLSFTQDSAGTIKNEQASKNFAIEDVFEKRVRKGGHRSMGPLFSESSSTLSQMSGTVPLKFDVNIPTVIADIT